MKYTPPFGGQADDPYIDAQPSAGVEGSIVPAAAIEWPQREIVEVIRAAGLLPDNTLQLPTALDALVDKTLREKVDGMLQSVVDKLFVGFLFDASALTPFGDVWVPAAGELLLRAERPLLWKFAQASGNLIDDSQWLADAANCGKYSLGDGADTFRAPDLRGEFIRALDQGRGVDAGRKIGSWQRGEFGSHTHGSGMIQTSAALGTGLWLGRGLVNNGSKNEEYTYPSGGDETRPRNVAYPVFIYAGAPA